MEVAIITVAGISSRFNEGISVENHRLKAIYYEKDKTETLLYHLIEQCMFADKIALVGGYQYDHLKVYCDFLPPFMKDKLLFIYNKHFADLASGYSLYAGIKEILDQFKNVDKILFVEGDLDIDKASFKKVIDAEANVLTYNSEAIYARKAVVLYADAEGHFKYAFNSSHGLLKIEDAFSLLFNSGQLWKFMDMDKLKAANEKFFEIERNGTNLRIIQNYIDLCDTKSFELIGLSRWINCNTREDYRRILKFWREDTK